MVQTSVIGCGNMGSALIKGLWRAGNHTVTACDLDPEALESVADYVDRTTSDVSEAAEADVVIVAVKPDIVGAVLEELDLSPEQTLLSIAAGVSTDYVEARTDANVVRIMPNLAAETGDMAAAVTAEGVTDEVRELLDDVGEFAEIDEAKMDIATAVNGSGPAFVFYLIQAMADAGVEGGLEPDDAETLAAQTFKGAAETVLRADRSVEELIDAVCSPNGTTIEGMEVLWDSDADADVAAAVTAAEERSAELAAEFDSEDDA
ncbi:pyrroline-5-carboxylate reductase [Natrinema sp. CBA1119]|uniref:pyrroline-5-carboxylate reductase n=1 Tax=Natrinema sp. CBA1119 TaxID=1608465 RepID=UPI000BF80F96|nr:pyrroline-5-carboxylate reductase [Natrinema sp. CBA1119]PGF16746.1 pyrroline-5-carboxylate reductase [Natrinema sp. CBA1119]